MTASGALFGDGGYHLGRFRPAEQSKIQYLYFFNDFWKLEVQRNPRIVPSRRPWHRPDPRCRVSRVKNFKNFVKKYLTNAPNGLIIIVRKAREIKSRTKI
jgi:hypothetical protein